ncbi:TlpA family protein disulfide reductase [Dyadobacter chenwenxiniae]|uniref:TlpA family protein disulfide reductase n=1 Tax=Dyadobacter chenwenxiniae TaxID=2906456 RepID=A0A9X1PN06_9BACT|nr:TlpA disulfide reductase family protein [Dyadobacter chenwenxiniae]MCF0063826.1 TlpA family protein disulfide reductase [Dyadobacter chenwenxiniae]UON83502.1 TlpA family protein disulfide reductase [Dyadobacter chenwenxiniae]
MTKRSVKFLLVAFVILGSHLSLMASEVRVTVKAKNMTGQPVLLFRANLLTFEADTIAVKKLSPEGLASFAVPVNKHLFVNLMIGQQMCTLLLSEGDALHVTLDKDVAPSFGFAGRGAGASTYMAESDGVRKRLETADGKHISGLDEKGFVSAIEKMSAAYETLNADFFSKYPIAKNIRNLLEQRNVLSIISAKMNFAAVNQFADPPKDIAPSIKNAYKELPLSDEMLDAGLYDYALALAFYSQVSIYDFLQKGKTPEEIREMEGQYAMRADDLIVSHNYPAHVSMLLRTRNLMDVILTGKNDVTDSLIARLKKEPAYSLYEPQVEKKYAILKKLAPGNPAPPISGVTPDGKTRSLADLKGKVVYVDVWATWCGPCIAEFPASKQLQKSFAGNDNVVFLYVSIDNKQQGWKNYLEANKDLKGLHINISDEGAFKRFLESYQSASIPKYILVDKEGKLADVNAPRPSSTHAFEAISKIL